MRLATQRRVEPENLDEQIRALRLLGNSPGFQAGSRAATRIGLGRVRTGLFHAPWRAISRFLTAFRGYGPVLWRIIKVKG